MATKNETARTPAIEATIEGTVLTLTFSDGRELVVTRDGLSHEIREAALMHGLKQKLVDAAAISRDPDTGRSATLDDKFNAVKEVLDRLMSGQWNKTREGGGGAGGLLFRALVNLYPKKTPADVRAYLDELTDKEQAAIRRVPAVAAEIDRLRAASARAGGIDGSAMLAGLGD